MTKRPIALLAMMFFTAISAGPARLPAATSSPTTAPAARTRTFFFDYDVTVKGLAPRERARIWLPIPPSNDEQTVATIETTLPRTAQVGCDAEYGNTIAHFEETANAAGEIPIRIRYQITRREVGTTLATDASDRRARDLQADRLVPVGGKPARLLVGRSLPTEPLALGRALYDLVDDHLAYRKDKPGWGRGDAGWACDSRFGNCTDFHSLFISLARTSHLPARFEIGFGVPTKRGAGAVEGYHCWARFQANANQWVPVDISEANKHPEKRDYFFGHLCENRVMFSTGRDLALVPKQDGPPLNFFVYPYVEVAGQAWPAEKLSKSFAFEDVPAAATPQETP